MASAAVAYITFLAEHLVVSGKIGNAKENSERILKLGFLAVVLLFSCESRAG